MSKSVSQDYIDWLKRHEGFSAKAYKDGSANGVQMYSIGYGHQIQPNEQHLRTATITTAQGEVYLKRDVKEREDYVNSIIKKSISQSQFEACVDCCYNAGVGAFGSYIAPKINAGNTTVSIAEYIRTWRTTSSGVQLQVLKDRRNEVANWYLGAGVGTFISKIKSYAFTLLAIAVACYALYYANGEKIPFYS